MGPLRVATTRHAAHAAAADDDADHVLVRTVECLEAASVDIELVCEPAFDYGRTLSRVDARRRRPPHRRRRVPA